MGKIETSEFPLKDYQILNRMMIVKDITIINGVDDQQNPENYGYQLIKYSYEIPNVEEESQWKLLKKESFMIMKLNVSWRKDEALNGSVESFFYTSILYSWEHFSNFHKKIFLI
ncbi:hypothetical protein F8M41_015064 [Gigaspora margarita]|uniref:Uncharacterized protein n=1 Tax=Gigaspora margarita TaxID=4874 RepID=A0A8H4AR92_GIGMA|nr:hypothetical protein F8M41_015064 [Gigaspora margarita]